MKCTQCNEEMLKGTTSFMSAQGFGQMMVTFTADTEKEKCFFKRDTKDKIVCSGEETESFYCPCCNRIMPIIELG